MSHFSQICTKSPLIHHLFLQFKQNNYKTELTLGSLHIPVAWGLISDSVSAGDMQGQLHHIELETLLSAGEQ